MKKTTYQARPADKKGFVDYSSEDQQVWHDLFVRQRDIVENRACDEYIDGLHQLKITKDQIPQIPDINQRLKDTTGWQVVPVPALIDFDTFFNLLANAKFPVATFIRRREDFDYIEEPDIFHEIFGHCPLLTYPGYADFMQRYGKLGLAATKAQKVMLARLYWFTVEFGLIQTDKGLRIYGGGILSSPGETVYALESEVPTRKPLDALEAFRTPYRIDIFQTVYFIIEHANQLYDVMEQDLLKLVDQALEMGMHPPTFPPKETDSLERTT